MRVAFAEGQLEFDGAAVTLVFSGASTDRVKKAVPARRIPIRDIARVELRPATAVAPAYVRVHRRAADPQTGVCAPHGDIDAMTVASPEQVWPQLEQLVAEVHRAVAGLPVVPPPPPPVVSPSVPSAPPPPPPVSPHVGPPGQPPPAGAGSTWATQQPTGPNGPKRSLFVRMGRARRNPSEWSFAMTAGAVVVAWVMGIATLGLTGVFALLPATLLRGGGYEDIDGDLMWPLAIEMALLWPLSLPIARILAAIWQPGPWRRTAYAVIVLVSITAMGLLLLLQASRASMV